MNSKRANSMCEADCPINIAIVTQPALRSDSMSRVLFEWRMASVLRARGMAYINVIKSMVPIV